MNLERDPYGVEVVEHLKRIGVDGLMMDLDDTCIYTAEIFDFWMRLYAKTVAETLEMEEEVFHSRLAEVNNEQHRKFGVNPTRWDMVVKVLSEELGDATGTIVGNVEILKMIYQVEPRIKPGVISTLQQMVAGGMKLGLVTHANVPWTEYKLRVTGLDRYFDAVVIADENGVKAVEHWRRGLELTGLQGERAVVIGDNLKGDIIPGISLGMRAIWLPSPWSVYREGSVPGGVIEINETDQLLEGLYRLR